MIKILNSLSGYLSYLRSQFHFPETVLAWYTVYSIQFLLDQISVGIPCFSFSFQFGFWKTGNWYQISVISDISLLFQGF